MKRIGISTDGFLSWNGGIDFIKHIIMGLDSVKKDKKLEIFIFIKSKQEYKKTRGVKRLFYKIKSKVKGNMILNSYPMFKEFANVKFVIYKESNLEELLLKQKIDILIPYLKVEYSNLKIRSAGYLYDCQHKYYPEFFKKGDIEARDKYFLEMINKSKKIIVNAKSVKEDLINFFNAKSENIFVLPFTPKLKLEYLEDYSKEIIKYNLPKKYFLISNQFWLHKDHPTAFRALAELLKEEKYKNIHLICTGLMEDGRRPEYIKELRNLIKDLDIQNNVKCLGLIPKNEQIQIMKGAISVIQTTLFEGGPGGGGIWDSIALGIPSIVSNIKTNLEIDSNLVSFFETKDYKDLSDKMKKNLKKNFIHFSKKELLIQSTKNTQKLGKALYNICFDSN